MIAMNLAKCHKSVVHTKKVVDPKNLGIIVPSLYLFFHDVSALQNLGKFLNIDLWKWNCTTSIMETHIAAIIMSNREIIY